MKQKGRRGIFGQVFLYTLLFITLIVGIAAVIFAQQFIVINNSIHEQQVMNSFQPLIRQIEENPKEEVLTLAEAFHEKNTSFEFSILTTDGRALFATSSVLDFNVESNGAAIQVQTDDNNNLPTSTLNVQVIPVTPADGTSLFISYFVTDFNAYGEVIKMMVIVLAIILSVSAWGAAIFARMMTNPIRRLAADTGKMSRLEPVSAPSIRADEIGQLAEDVHHMYQKLKATISDLEIEIERKKELEENQRHFFSAASHELKTPIAATSALLEGMIENIGEYKDHPKYLQECLKMMNAQGRLVSEILEIVRLTDGKVQPRPVAVKLQALVMSILPIYQPLADTREQIITVSIPDTLLCTIDPQMFDRVFSNVLMNAVQNTSIGGEIRIWCEEKEKVRLNILNTDAHIDETALTKIFEPFYRPDISRYRRQGHSGLGLTIVKKMLNTMDVPFSLKNSGKDVLFWMDLPLA